MATPRYAWDSCTWIAMIIQEHAQLKDGTTEDRGKLCNHVIELAAKKQLEIVTSGLALAEVCKHEEVKAVDGDDFSDFFRNDYILVVAIDRDVGTLARKLMQSGYPGLKPPDAVHLATAIVADVKELHTFDAKLLGLDGKLEMRSAGVLQICKPFGPPPSLLDRL
jgi:predicted nucleic acid-binding protein